MKALGDKYEDSAVKLLQECGLVLLERNFKGRSGEIDIIAQDGEQLVFVEVRARSNPSFGSAASSVNKQKQRRIVKTAQLFLQRWPHRASMSCRFDVIAFEPPQSDAGPQISWIRDAFTG
jgi:putative endonuclease